VISKVVGVSGRWHLRVENDDRDIASVEVLYHVPEYGNKVLLYVTLDDDDTEVELHVRPTT
jgi:hypothetical protein